MLISPIDVICQPAVIVPFLIANKSPKSRSSRIVNVSQFTGASICTWVLIPAVAPSSSSIVEAPTGISAYLLKLFDT